ncbi:MAG TPA: ABC transporter permease [Thermoanaerobaculia bacterium]|jgi:predicted permease|nr:ABC transporter permease [Thermoanaerobaculia bacterium]
MSALVQDLRFAARGLARQPGLVLAAVLTLALGIGGNTAIFSVVDSALLMPPPFRDPGRLVVAWASNPGLAQSAGLADKLPVSYGDFYDWRRQSRGLERLALVQPATMALTGQGDPRQLDVVRVTGDFSALLGTPAALGRGLVPADEVPGKAAAVLLSDTGWRRWFGGDPHVVGRQVVLDGNPVVVAGVMPRRFAFPRASEMPAFYGFAAEPDAWVPLALRADQLQDQASRIGVAIGRLRPGVGIAAAQAELAAICGQLERLHPRVKGWTARLEPLSEQLVGDLRPGLLMLWGAGGLVLLISCANVANLLLARAAGRRREIAVRTALGAGRGRLVAQLLLESCLLALAGGVLGLAVAAAGLRLFAAAAPPVARAFIAGSGAGGGGAMGLDGRVLAFTAVLCLAASIMAGLAPMVQTGRPDLAELLRGGARAGTGTVASRRTRNGLVMAEVALAVVLVIGAGLLLRSLISLLGVDPGFRAAGVLSFEIDRPEDPARQAPRLALLFQRVADRLRALPGAAAAGGISELPLSGVEAKAGVYIEGRPVPEKPEEVMFADSREIVPGYFEAMGIPLREGRLLDAGDAAGKPLAAVIDEVMARTFWPHEDPLGKRFRRATNPRRGNDAANPWYTVVGVVGTVRQALGSEPQPQMYRTAAQILPALASSSMAFVIRTRTDPAAMTAAVRAAVRQVDSGQPITKVRTLEQVVSGSVSRRRFSLMLLGFFAALALALSAVGIYGVTSYSVAQRTRELGLRVALGARPRAVLGLVVGEAALLAGGGVLLGAGGALALGRILSSLLYGVGAADPPTFGAAAAGLLLVAVAAAWSPGRRATEVDPIVALRSD